MRKYIFIILPLCAIILYWNTLHHPFLFDDQPHIQLNPAIRISTLSATSLWNAAFHSPASNRLLSNITFALNYYFHEFSLPGYHVVNILIHIMTGLLLYLFFKLTLDLVKRDRNAGGCGGEIPNSSLIAFAAALVWLVHPLHTQSVTYIVQRMNSMSAMFYLAAMVMYIMGRRESESRRVRYVWYAGTALSSLLALGSKEIAATLPVFIFLYEWYFFQGVDFNWFKKKILPLCGITAIIVLIAIFYLGLNPLQTIFGGYQNRDFSLVQRVMTEWRVVFLYITLLFYPNPSRLNLDYDFPLSYSLFDPISTILSLLIILGLIVSAVYLLKRDRLISFCILWFLGNLVIESSVLGLELVFEHRTYLPSMMAVLAIVVLVARYIRFTSVKCVLLSGIVVLFSFWTFERNAVWSNEVLLWQDCVHKSPGKARPHYNLGLSYANIHDNDNAIIHYKEALEINPTYTRAHNNLGIALGEQGMFYDAIQHFKKAIELEPGYAMAYNNLGIILARQGKIDEAIEQYNRALTLDPEFTNVHINIGAALANGEKYPEAIYQYNEVLRKNPESTEALVNMAIAYARMGNYRRAKELLITARNYKPDDDEIYKNLGVLYALEGENTEAIQFYKEALKINPRKPETHYNLGIALDALNRTDEAITHYKIALTLRPAYADAHNNLGVALMQKGLVDEAVGHFKEALLIKPSNIKSQLNYEKAIDIKEDIDTAIARIEKRLDENPNDTALLNTLGDLYQIKGNTGKAVSLYLKIPSGRPEFAQALNNLAIVYTIKGEYDTARSLLTKILELKPDNPVAYYNIACIYAKQNKAEDAVAWLEKASQKGFTHWDYLKKDPDLDTIRGSTFYNTFILRHS